MKKSIFDTRGKEIADSVSMRTLVLHLYDSERWPLNLEALFGTLKGNGISLAMGIMKSHSEADPMFQKYAEQLAQIYTNRP
ncbi:MAG: hypothetical protein AB7E55_06690 [Pigmentiphaga sp.]